VSALYHTPVLANALIDELLKDKPGWVVDATLGGGGHALEMLRRAPQEMQLIGIDRDADAIAAAGERLKAFEGRALILQGDFRNLDKLLAEAGVAAAEAVYADLGVSSHQIDSAERGFSYLNDGPLDMRMDSNSTTTAAMLLQNLSSDELTRIFQAYGEERLGRRIAKRIERERRHRPLTRTFDLVEIVSAVVPRPGRIKSLSRIFQALRIAVNDEMTALADFLSAALRVLAPGGKLAVISYHSLEDRQVKRFFKRHEKGCVCPPEMPMCICGRRSELSILTRKAVRPGETEIQNNPRARSAKLRVAQKRING
jgi:16S rRNA (cytosine1402-N4)-methyltransferase